MAKKQVNKLVYEKKKNAKDYSYLSEDTQIELVAINGEKCFREIMTIAEANKFPKKRGWTYLRFQVGFCQFKQNIFRK